jgi:hypothetical protein
VSSWSCPHEVDGVCQRVRGAICDPGMLGCVLQGSVERLGEPAAPRRPVRAPTNRDERPPTPDPDRS